MSIQSIVNTATKINIDRRKVVGQTVSRSLRIKTAQRNSSQPFKFTVSPAPIYTWEVARPLVEYIMAADRNTEVEVNLANNPRMSYLTEYQGGLNQQQMNATTVTNFTGTTLTLSNLPTIGAVSYTYNRVVSAASFANSTSILYNRAFSTARSDFLINNTTYDAYSGDLQPGYVISATTYVTGGQTILSVTRNYITLAGVGYTRIVMSAVPNANSPSASSNLGSNINTTVTHYDYVSSTTVVAAVGDYIQPFWSRYPYLITTPAVRGVGSTVDLTTNRARITSESTTITNASILVGTQTNFTVVVTGLPTYEIGQYRRVNFSGDFELVEKIV
jgi:hypothetical protein